jgi:hypothetical protein
MYANVLHHPSLFSAPPPPLQLQAIYAEGKEHCLAVGVMKMSSAELLSVNKGTVLVFRQEFTLEDAISIHTCLLASSRRVTHSIPLRWPLLVPVHTVNCVPTRKELASKWFTF